MVIYDFGIDFVLSSVLEIQVSFVAVVGKLSADAGGGASTSVYRVAQLCSRSGNMLGLRSV